MTRKEGYTLLTKYLKNKNLLKHSLAAEAAMRGIYEFLYKNKPAYSTETEEKYGLAGLLHDIDYEIAMETNQLDKHGTLIFTPDKEPNTIPEDIAHAIKAHNYTKTGVNPENDMDWGIFAADQLTGLIVAGALVHPEKKLAPLTADYILKRFKEKSFARGANRESIMTCESKLNIPLKDFVTIVLTSMQEIHEAIGL